MPQACARFGLWLTVLLLSLPLLAQGAYAGEPAPLEEARASVVSVLPDWPASARGLEEPEGSGVVFGDGTLVLTADHVLGPQGHDAPTVRVRSSDGLVLAAKVLSRNSLTDIALLSIDEPLAPARFAPAPPALGSPVCAIGNAFGLGLSVACGSVSALHRSGTGFNAIEDFLQTDAAVNPGMSGGALVDAEGRVVGLLSAIFTKQSDANIGVNFAIHAGLVQRVAEALVAKGRFRPLSSGTRVEPHPGRGALGREGARVVSVKAGSPAAAAGIQPGDVLIASGTRRLRKTADWVSVIANAKPGVDLPVTLLRDGTDLQVILRFPGPS